MTTYTPLNQRILIRRRVADNPTIVTPDVVDHPDDRYFVEAVAPDAVFSHDNERNVVVPGDEVLLLPRTAVQVVGHPDENLGLVHISALAAIIHRSAAAFAPLP